MTPDRPDATDALFDTSPRAMAARFGEVVLERLRTGRELGGAARMAWSYALEAQREEDAAAVIECVGGRRGGKSQPTERTR